jgi:hypothetical protein
MYLILVTLVLGVLGTGIIAQGLGKDVEVADKAGVNAVENNALATGAVLLTVAAVAELIDKVFQPSCLLVF